MDWVERQDVLSEKALLDHPDVKQVIDKTQEQVQLLDDQSKQLLRLPRQSKLEYLLQEHK